MPPSPAWQNGPSAALSGGFQRLADISRMENFHEAKGGANIGIKVVLLRDETDHQRVILRAGDEGRSTTVSLEGGVIGEKRRLSGCRQQGRACEDTLTRDGPTSGVCLQAVRITEDKERTA